MTEAVEWQLDVELPADRPRSHVESSYTSYYTTDAAGNDVALRLHPNGLCVITLAPTHAALRAGSGSGGGGAAAGAAAAGSGDAACVGAVAAPPRSAEEGPGQQTAAQAAAAGSAAPQAAAAAARVAFGPKLLQAEFRKGRGPLLHTDTVLGRLSAGGAEYVLRCGVRGLLIELNERLQGLQGEALLRELERSYLAILDVRAAEAAHLAGRCLSEEQYRQRQVEQQQAQQQEAEQQDAEQQPSEQQAEQPVEKLSPSELLQSEQQQQQPLGEPQAVQQSS